MLSDGSLIIFFAILRKGPSALPGRAVEPSGKMICMISLLPPSLFGFVKAAVLVDGVVVVPVVSAPPPTNPLLSVGVGVVDVVVLGVSDGRSEVTDGVSGAFGTAGSTGWATGLGRLATCVVG